MLLYNLIITGILVSLFVILSWNLKLVRRVSAKMTPEKYPFVSVLVPARNEETNIERCVRSLAGQDYPHFEVLVLDDHSEDGTWEILKRLCGAGPKVRAFKGKDLPEGWLGKCFACHQLAQEAQGEFLLFTDADTVHDPAAIRASVAEMERGGGDFLTLITRLELKSFWERLFLPLVPFVALCYLPFIGVEKSKNPVFAVGNGQFMLFRRYVYDAIGGHPAVKDAIVEDVWLARRVKAGGYKILVRDGFELVGCRMYRNFREIWEGFSKNVFAGFNYSLPFVLVTMIGFFLEYLAPFFILALGLLKGKDPLTWIFLPLLQVLIAIVMRLMIAARLGFEKWSCFFHGLAVVVFLAISANSIRWILFGRGALWKGRRYQFHLTQA